MKNLKEILSSKLNESFYKNVGVDMSKAKEWFDQVPVVFDQYLTKWDTKHIVKDRDSFTIIFPNLYKKDHDKKDVILDLSPYIEQLSKIDPQHIYINFSTGLYTADNNIKINNTEKKAKDDANDNFYGWDKKIRIAIIETIGTNPHPEKQIISGSDVNRMISMSHSSSYGSQMGRRSRAFKNNSNLLLNLIQYTDDYPYRRDGWTVTVNNLEK